MKTKQQKRKRRLKTNPYRYQRKGIRKIRHFNGRCLLAWEMGLGKSLASLAWAVKVNAFPVIIVCPAMIKINWQREIRKHFGSSSTKILYGMKPDENGQILKSSPFDFVIVNYDILGPWLDWLKALKPHLIILDECHMIKNARTQRFRNTRRLCKKVPNVLALSGTPLTNRPAELFTTLKLLRPDIWSNFMEFAWEFCKPKRMYYGGWTFRGARRLDKLHAMLNQYVMSRFRKADVLGELPAKSRTIIPLSIRNRREYETAEASFISWLGKKSKLKARRARKAKELTKTGYLKRLAAELKFPEVCEWIDSFLEESDDKLVVFAVHKEMIANLRERYAGISVVVDGSTTTKTRMDSVDKFQRSRKCRLFIGNIQAAGVGINLTEANNVAFVEMGWTPGEHTQAEDRTHRIGQFKSVSVYYLVAENTIEEKLCSIIKDKQAVLDQTLDGEVAGDRFDVFDRLLRELKNRRRKQ